MKAMLVRLSTLVVLITVLASASASTVKADGPCWTGGAKGVIWDGREWHHFVEFYPNMSAYFNVYGPANPSVWGWHTWYAVRAGYRWPSDWWDPFPPSWFTLCAR